MNRPESSAVAGCHILVECFDCIGPGHLAVFFVHVVRAGAGVVTDPDAEVLNFHGAFLMDLAIRNFMSQTIHT
jgi:hypothetical protein